MPGLARADSALSSLPLPFPLWKTALGTTGLKWPSVITETPESDLRFSEIQSDTSYNKVQQETCIKEHCTCRRLSMNINP